MTLDRLKRRSIYSLPCNSTTPFKKDDTQISKKKNSRWEPDLIEELIRSICNFKTKMLFQCKDFQAEKHCLY